MNPPSRMFMFPVECKNILLYIISNFHLSDRWICLHYLHISPFSSEVLHMEKSPSYYSLRKSCPSICMSRYAYMVLQFLRIIGMKGEEKCGRNQNCYSHKYLVALSVIPFRRNFVLNAFQPTSSSTWYPWVECVEL